MDWNSWQGWVLSVVLIGAGVGAYRSAVLLERVLKELEAANRWYGTMFEALADMKSTLHRISENTTPPTATTSSWPDHP